MYVMVKMIKAEGNTLLQQMVAIEVIINNNVEVTDLRHRGYQIVSVGVE